MNTKYDATAEPNSIGSLVVFTFCIPWRVASPEISETSVAPRICAAPDLDLQF